MFFNAVIFDLDNTLYDYDVCNKKAIEKVADYIGYKGNFNKIYVEVTKKYKLETGNTAASHNRFNYFKWIKEHLKLDFSLTKVNDLFWETYISHMELFEGVIDFLNFLKNNNIKIGLLTDFQTEYQYRKLEKLGILEYFDVIVTSEEVGIEKPSTKGFQYCLSKLGELPGKTIMIGDSMERDIKGAKDTGIYPIKFSNEIFSKLSFEYENTYQEGKMGIFSSYVELTKVFKSIEKDTDTLVWLSRKLGQRYDLTQAAGGNISIKNDHMMMIKSSGVNLYDLTNKNGYSLISYNLTEDVVGGKYKNISDYNVIINGKASMETYMHSYLKKYTIHLHPIEVNKILVRKDAKEIIHNLFPKCVVFIDYIEPGVELSKAIYEKIKHINHGNFFTENNLGDDEGNRYVEYTIFLANHGLIISANTSTAVIRNLNYVLDKCEKYNNTKDSYRYKNVTEISDAMKGRYRDGDYLSYLVEDSVINNTIKTVNFESVFPDKVIYCGVNIFFMENSENIREVTIGNKLYGLREKPSVFLLGNDVYISSTSMKKCREIESVLKAHLMILKDNDNVNYISIEEQNKLLNMEAEKYRQNL